MRVHGKKTNNDAGFTGPIRKITSPAMTAAVLRTKTGALSPVQHVLQVQNAKITALRSVVKRLQDSKTTEQAEQTRSLQAPSAEEDEHPHIDFESKRTQRQLETKHIEADVKTENRLILPSLEHAREQAERESQLKNQYNWRRLADVQVIQASTEPDSTTSVASLPPAGGSPPKALAHGWPEPVEEEENGWQPPARTLYGPGLTNTRGLASSGALPERYTIASFRMVLGLEYSSIGADGSAQRVAFRNELQQDFANACGLPPSSFVLKRLSPGSVLVDCDIHPDPAQRGPDPVSAAISLEQQTRDPNSPLRAGSLTRFASGITISQSQRVGSFSPFSTMSARTSASYPNSSNRGQVKGRRGIVLDYHCGMSRFSKMSAHPASLH